MLALSSLLTLCVAAFAGRASTARVNTYNRAFQLPTIVGNTFGVAGINASYDYVIVGGGTAGLAIAARLAQNFSVAVVEAGGFYEVDNGNLTIVPGLYGALTVSPLVDWGFETAPQTGLYNRSLYYVRGKTLGGSSARNYLAYHRPTVGSMQRWADLVGDQSYAWENVLQYYDRSIDITLPNEANRYPNSSIDLTDTSVLANAQSGPVQVTWANYAGAILSWFYQAFPAVGIMTNHQAFLGGVVNGIAYIASTMDPTLQQRSTSQSAYMYDAMLSTDIKVYTNSLAKQIMFDNNKTATGVLINTGGVNFYLNATKEVILSAGTLQSPQLLMVSGVGPSETLQKFNIPVVKDLPGVGQEMWDHIYVGTDYAVDVQTTSRLPYDPEFAAESTEAYLTNQTGVFTAPPGLLAWERLSDQNISGISLSPSTDSALSWFPSDWPELEYFPEDFASTLTPDNGLSYATILVGLVAPLSRGNVTITSNDTSDPPVINPNYLSNPGDVDLLLNGLKRVRQVWAKLTNVTIGSEFVPGANITTDDQLTNYIRQNASPVYHASATCKMGMSNDTMAVVDPQARVYGVQNLRVVDASAFPFLPPGHPQSSVYMLAEKIADDILNGALSSYSSSSWSRS